jgi:hypothetical protein
MLPLGGLHVKHAVQNGIWVPTNFASKQGMQVRESWGLLCSNWVGLGNPGGQQF